MGISGQQPPASTRGTWAVPNKPRMWCGQMVALLLLLTIVVNGQAQFEDEEVSPRQSRAAFSGMRGRRAPFNGMRGKRVPTEEDYELMADLMEKRAPFNGMRGKRGEELVGQHQPDQDLLRQFERYLYKRRSGRSMGFNGMRGR